MKPFQDGMWGRLTSGALVWVEGGMPTRVRMQGKARAAIEEELAQLTGAMFQLVSERALADGWAEADVVQVGTREDLRSYRLVLAQEFQALLGVDQAGAAAAERLLYRVDQALAGAMRADDTALSVRAARRGRGWRQ